MTLKNWISNRSGFYGIFFLFIGSLFTPLLSALSQPSSNAGDPAAIHVVAQPENALSESDGGGDEPSSNPSDSSQSPLAEIEHHDSFGILSERALENFLTISPSELPPQNFTEQGAARNLVRPPEPSRA